MEPFIELIIAMGGFVLTHMALSAEPLRGPLVNRLGKIGFIVFYNLVSIVFFVWAVMAFGAAPYVELWPLTAAAGVFAIAVMPVAAVLLVAGYSTPNPLSTIGAKHIHKPPRGIIRVTRHPVMWSAAIIGVAHITTNGDVASVIFWTLFVVVALAGAWHMDGRMRERYGEAYHQLAAVTSFVPFVAMVQGRTSVTLDEIGWWRIIAGFALYCVLLLGHGWLIGPDLLANL